MGSSKYRGIRTLLVLFNGDKCLLCGTNWAIHYLYETSISVSRASSRGICGGPSGTATGFSASTSVLPCLLSLHQGSIHIHLHVALTRRINGQSIGSFGNQTALDKKTM